MPVFQMKCPDPIFFQCRMCVWGRVFLWMWCSLSPSWVRTMSMCIGFNIYWQYSWIIVWCYRQYLLLLGTNKALSLYMDWKLKGKSLNVTSNKNSFACGWINKLSYTLWLTVLDWTYYTGFPSWGAWGEPGNESHLRVQWVSPQSTISLTSEYNESHLRV